MTTKAVVIFAALLLIVVMPSEIGLPSIGSRQPLRIAHSATSPIPDFSVSVKPSRLIFPVGDGDNATVNVGSMNAFAGIVDLSVRISPYGALCTLTHASIKLGASGSSSLLCSSGSPGVYSVNVTGTSGSISRSARFDVFVCDSCGIWFIPLSLTIPLGTKSNATLFIPSIGSFSHGNITLTTSVSPSHGLSCSFHPSIVTPVPNASVTSTMSCIGTVTGLYVVVITGTVGSFSHAQTVNVTVVTEFAPDFSVSVTPKGLIFSIGDRDNATVTVASMRGFTGAVDLSLKVSPAAPGQSCILNPTTVTVPFGSSGSSSLRCESTAASPSGSYSVNITATSGNISHSTSLTVTLCDSCARWALYPDLSRIPAYTTVNATMQFLFIGSLSHGNITFTVSISPSNGLSCSFHPSIIKPIPNAIGTSQLSCTGTVPGQYSVGLIGTAGSSGRVQSMTITVVEDFSLSTSPPAPSSIMPGGSAEATVKVQSYGFTGTITLTAIPVVSGLRVAFAPTSVSVTPGGAAISTLTISSDSTVANNTYTITVTGISGGIIHYTSLIILLVPPPPSHAGSSGNTALQVDPRTTSTTVTCRPQAVQVDETTTCTATVTDIGPGTPSTPTGTVTWKTNGTGHFNPPDCNLVGTGASASCTVKYTPADVGSQQITAIYGGDGNQTPPILQPVLFVVQASPPRTQSQSLMLMELLAIAGVVGTCGFVTFAILAARRYKPYQRHD